eukprot:gnl/MRDRNA2_/MRDRNA2_66789_c0_seq2.p1 gnl/MRDRNA2_/MRDRNA2_66789_c0~~gnl/MRDRNA2_/MRDRNA2_66789_c0_seq2.p1  ORF type:complete len:241 (+),score=42.05 gnl/MRDRNA2_/MRDRNA2_66789_c0_seq2:79-801(+)
MGSVCYSSKCLSPEDIVDKAGDFGELIIGVAGTGMMASAHAYRHAQIGLPVVIGSRDPAKGKRLAQSIGGKCEGSSQREMVEKANFIILAIPPIALRDFMDTHREVIVGKGKMFVDLSVTFSRYGGTKVQPPTQSDGPNWCGPYFDMVNYLRDRLNDSSSSWVKAWHNLYYKSIKNNKVQPVECAGDPAAKDMAFKILLAEGWEPLDCGGIQDIPKIETGFHERRWRHPRHIEFNGPNHP